jgi:hypothetical protein
MFFLCLLKAEGIVMEGVCKVKKILNWNGNLQSENDDKKSRDLPEIQRNQIEVIEKPG